MTSGIHMHDVVALLDDVPVQHFESGKSLVLIINHKPLRIART